MMDTSMAVLLEIQNTASPELKRFAADIEQTSTQVKSASGSSREAAEGLGQGLAHSTGALRTLASGVGYLGSTFLGLGIAMKQSNNELAQSLGTTLMMSGAVMSSVASAAHFVAAIGKMIKALEALRVQQILTQAFSGPLGWAALAVGAGVATGAIISSSNAAKAPEAAPTRQGYQQILSATQMPRPAETPAGSNSQQSIVVNQNISGSVVSERQLVDAVQKGLLEKSSRNYGTGVR